MKYRMQLMVMTMAGGLACLPMSAQMNGHGAAAQAVNNPNQNGMGAMADSTAGSGMDATFLKKAAQANMAEISAGQMAVGKSSNDQVKTFGQKMVDDHTAMEKDVEALASSMKVTLPTAPMKSDQMMAQKLQAMSGADFDKGYIAGQVKDHKKVLEMMKSENSSTQNAQLKDLTTKGIAKVSDHLKMAEQLESQMGKSKM